MKDSPCPERSRREGRVKTQFSSLIHVFYCLLPPPSDSLRITIFAGVVVPSMTLKISASLPLTVNRSARSSKRTQSSLGSGDFPRPVSNASRITPFSKELQSLMITRSSALCPRSCECTASIKSRFCSAPLSSFLFSLAKNVSRFFVLQANQAQFFRDVYWFVRRRKHCVHSHLRINQKKRSAVGDVIVAIFIRCIALIHCTDL